MTIACRRFVYGEGWLEVDTTLSAVALPGTLTAAPGYYSYAGAKFECVDPGLYLFMNPGPPITSQYRLLSLSLGEVGFNLEHIVQGLAEWCVIGDYDMLDNNGNIQSINFAFAAALHRQPVITCEYTCKFAQTLLAQRGVTSRICRVLSADPLSPWLGYGDVGHVMLEVQSGATWILYDFLSDRTWDMSFAALMDDLGALDLPVYFGDSKESAVNKTERSAYFKCWLGGRETLARQQEWDDRIFGVPFIDGGGGSIGYNPVGKSYGGNNTTLPTGYALTTKETWLATFYP